MSDLLFAIRSRNEPGFVRSGVRFSFDRWLLVENPTEAQLTEKSLICAAFTDPNFRKLLGPLPIANPELLPDTTPDDNFIEHLVRSMATANRELAMERADLRVALDKANEQIVTLTGELEAFCAEAAVDTAPDGTPDSTRIETLEAVLDAARANRAKAAKPAVEAMTVTINADTKPVIEAIEKSLAALTETADYAPGHNSEPTGEPPADTTGETAAAK